jgi:hypothetical protein
MNKRVAPRVSILGNLYGDILVVQPMRIAGLSRTGISIETAFPLQLDSLHDLKLMLGPTTVIVKARVVHCRISDVDQDVVVYRSGLEFIGVQERAAAALGTFIDAIAGERTDV